MRHRRSPRRTLRSLLDVMALGGLPEARPARSMLPRAETLEGRILPTVFWAPQLGNETATDNGGPKLTNSGSGAPIYPIFWGSYWTTTQGRAEEASYDSAITQVLFNTAYLTGLSEYGVHGKAFRTGNPDGGGFNTKVEITNYEPPVSGENRENTPSVVNDAIYNHNMPRANTYSNTGIYFVITPPGIGSSGDLAGAGGYHTNMTDSNGVANTMYGWIATDHTIDRFTYTLSHEVTEAVTDPLISTVNWGVQCASGSGFSNPPGFDEICDFESQNHGYRLNGYVVNSYWSQANHKFEVQDGNSQTALINNGNQLVINGDQFGAGSSDSITVTTSNGGVQIVLNGQTFTFDQGVISNVVINPGGGNNFISVLKTPSGVPVTIASTSTDTVTIGNNGSMQSILGDVVLNDPPSWTSLTLDDSADSTPRSFTVTASNTYGLAPGVISYVSGDLSALNINAGSGGNSVVVSGTPFIKFGAPVLLNTGTGVDSVTITAITNALNLNGASGQDSVLVGNPTSVQGIQAPLMISNSGSYSAVTVDDSADSTPRTFVLTGNVLTGLAPAAITFAGGDIDSLTIKGGYAGNTITVNGTPQSRNGTTIAAGNGTDTVSVLATNTDGLTLDGVNGFDNVTIGNAGSVQGITGAVTIDNVHGYSNVTIDDSADLTPRSLSLSNGGVTGLAPAAIDFVTAYGVLNTLAIRAGSGGNTITVNSTPSIQSGSILLSTGTGIDHVTVKAASTPLTVNGYNGTDTVVIGNAGNMQGITAPLTLDNPGSYSAVTLDDSADATARTVTLNNGSVTGLAPAPINFVTVYYFMSSLSINLGSGNDSLTAASRPFILAGAPVILNGGAGANTLVGPSIATAWNIAGPNSGSFPGVSFSNFGGLTGGLSDDTFQFAPGSSASGTVNGGGGTNTLDYSAYNATIAVDFAAGTATATGGIANIASVLGSNSSSNSLAGANTSNNWYLTGANSGSLNAGTFTNIQYLSGGSVADYFAIAPLGTLSGQISGGSGAEGVYAGNRPNVWSLTGLNAGSLNGLLFAGIPTLFGSGMADLFQFGPGAGVTGVVHGVGPSVSNTLDYSAYNAPVVVDLTNQTATGTGGITEFGNIVGSPLTNNSLTGPNSSTPWNITGLNAGTVAGVAFSNFGMLINGPIPGTFILGTSAALTGHIDGGPNAAVLNGPNLPSAWTITGPNAGSVNGIAFTNISGLLGGAANDTFKFIAGGSISGIVNGGGGDGSTNTLDYSAYGPATYDLGAGTATATGGIVNIQSVAGIVDHFQVSLFSSVLPPSENAGEGFLFAVTAQDASFNTITGYTGPVHFTSSDTQAVLPLDGFLTSGVGYFAATFKTAGPQAITVRDVSDFSLAGTSDPIPVNPSTPSRLVFGTLPSGSVIGSVLAPVVANVVDAYGNVITTANAGTITLSVASGPGSFTASSTASMPLVNGAATFTNLTLTKPGTYTLAEALSGATPLPSLPSSPFTVSPLKVVVVAPTASGFVAKFNTSVSTANLQLYGSGHPAAGIVLQASKLFGGGPTNIPGTVFIDTSTKQLTFQASNNFLDSASYNAGVHESPILPDGHYTIMFPSGSNGLQDILGNGLAGDGNTAGTPYSSSFDITPGQYSAATYYLPDFAQGPTQTVKVPSDTELGNQTLEGLPLALTDGAGATQGSVMLQYDPSLLTLVPGGTPAAGIMSFNAFAPTAGIAPGPARINGQFEGLAPWGPAPYLGILAVDLSRAAS